MEASVYESIVLADILLKINEGTELFV